MGEASAGRPFYYALSRTGGYQYKVVLHIVSNTHDPRLPLQPENQLPPADPPSLVLLQDCFVLWDAAMAAAESHADRRGSERGIGAEGDNRQWLNEFRAQERGWAMGGLTLRCIWWRGEPHMSA